MPHIFLSHSHIDKKFAQKIATDLSAAGHRVWIDDAEISVGDSLIEKLSDGLDKADYICALLSTASITSPWVQRELDIGSNKEIEEGRVVVLPLMLESVELPGFLKGKFYGDFRDKDNYQKSLEKLLMAIDPARKFPDPEFSKHTIDDEFLSRNAQRVICSHFFRKGELPRALWRADLEFTDTFLSKQTVRGYQFWAIPCVRLMRRSRVLESIMFPIAYNRAVEIGYRMGVSPRGSFAGKAIRLLVEPLCFVIGAFVPEQKWQDLWIGRKSEASAKLE